MSKSSPPPSTRLDPARKPQLAAKLTRAIWERFGSRYSGTFLLVALKLAGLTRPETECFADCGVRYLAVRCGCSERGVQKILRKLEHDGVLKTLQRAGGRGTNRYYLQLAEIERMPHVDPAYELSERYAAALTKKYPDTKLPNDWKRSWPDTFEQLLARGVSLDQIRDVASWGLNHALPLAIDPLELARNFDRLVTMKATRDIQENKSNEQALHAQGD